MYQAFYSKKFTKTYKTLPPSIRKKADKQIAFLLKDIRHPSVRAKKLERFSDVWEGRVDRFYRLVFTIDNNIITLIRIGPHDEGLGKK